jgi:hypothetical protein
MYLIGSAVLGIWAYSLQRPIYHPSPPPGEMYAVVFVRDPAAHVILSAKIYPNQPWEDQLSVSVGHVPRAQAGWLLVIECPTHAPPAHAANLTSDVGQQAQLVPSKVTADPGIGNRTDVPFGCVPAPTNAATTLAYPPNLANVSVAALQLDDGMVGAAAPPMVYAWRGSAASQGLQLLQVFPNATCPSAAPPSTTSASSPPSTSPESSSGPATSSPQASSSQTSSSQTSSSQTSSSPSYASSSPVPSASAVPTIPANPRCLSLASASAKISQWAVPVSESTIETLYNVDYKHYQISMYPTGNTPFESNGEETVIWQAPSAQDPNFAATDDTAQLNGQKNLFISGVLWGIMGGAVVAFLDHCYEAYRERKEKSPGRPIRL